MTAPVVVGHIKDHFLPRSETFIYAQVTGLRRYRALVLDRHRRQHRDLFPFDAHESPAERFGPWAGWLERLALRAVGRSPYLEWVIQRANVRILHAHFGQLGALFAPVARRHRLPLITSFHGVDVSRFARAPAWRDRFQLLWRCGQRFVAVGPKMAETLISLGAPRERVTIIPVPVNAQRFTYRERLPPGRGDPVHLLTVGRLVPKKGVDILLKAFARLSGGTPVHLWIVGDGPERTRLENLAHTLGLGQRVVFWGWQPPDQVAHLMAKAHIFVLASRTDPVTGETEGTPTVLLEAQARGLPVISTRHADIPFIVREEESGILVPENNVEALAAALETLLRHPERWPHMGRAGRTLIEERHDTPRVIAQLEDLYDQVLAESVPCQG